MKHRRYLILAAISATAISSAFAAETLENDAMAINAATIPLTQAVTTAEQHAHGKASRAEYEKTKTGWAYDVEVVSGSKVFDVKVDAVKGTVIASSEDQIDRDGEHDEQD